MGRERAEVPQGPGAPAAWARPVLRAGARRHRVAGRPVPGPPGGTLKIARTKPRATRPSGAHLLHIVTTPESTPLPTPLTLYQGYATGHAVSPADFLRLKRADEVRYRFGAPSGAPV
jgi:hypothetical protein